MHRRSDLFVEGEQELRVAREIALHLDGAVDAAVEHVAVAVEGQVDALVDVDEDLVLALALVRVLDRDRLVDRGGGRRLGVELGDLELGRGLLHDHRVVEHVRLDDLRARALRVAPAQEEERGRKTR